MFINLTAHDYVQFEGDTETLRIAPSGKVARVINRRVRIEDTEGVPTVRLHPARVELLDRNDMLQKRADAPTFPFPPEQDGVYYIVSAMIATALPRRNDLRVPDTDAAILNARGQIIGVPGFIRYS